MPYGYNISCWCTAPLGSYASPLTNCFATPCPFPNRCVLENPALPNNGTTCTIGSTGAGCAKCSLRYYRYLNDCRPCPTGVNPAVVVLGVFLVVGLLYVGPKLAQLSSPQAVALLRSLVMYCQYLSISFDLHLRWPAGLLAFFAWLKALTNGIQLAAPECLAGNWSYYLYVRLLLIGVAVLFSVALAFAELNRLLKAMIRDTANLQYLEKLNMRRNGMKQFCAFGTHRVRLHLRRSPAGLELRVRRQRRYRHAQRPKNQLHNRQAPRASNMGSHLHRGRRLRRAYAVHPLDPLPPAQRVQKWHQQRYDANLLAGPG